ncbi:PREDICTED: protein FAM173B isoform X1 [Diuraphis noxia]|uniref:protein FAM173B isoform X1 n=2 Tax=Diuraphis noxia TaxID=143948 RepID=UPI00076392BC|nr:PREDICTED: protein FAM173B isoform X1 [Diuraphis noxia]XP_015363495.1 PREDICTED: protein FAM173B isoform X1 [Diuraphis noxia]
MVISMSSDFPIDTNLSFENVQSVKNDRSLRGLFLVGLTGGISIALSIICYPFISPALRKVCLPYVPATNLQIQNVLNVIKGRKGKLVDLGSGDGRIVMNTAKAGFESVGIELNFWLVMYSRLVAMKSKIQPSPKFIRTDLWKYNLGPFTNIVIFGVEEMMLDLEKKFSAELSEGTVIVACRFPLPNLEPYLVVGTGIDRVWAYRISKTKT